MFPGAFHGQGGCSELVEDRAAGFLAKTGCGPVKGIRNYRATAPTVATQRALSCAWRRRGVGGLESNCMWVELTESAANIFLCS